VFLFFLFTLEYYHFRLNKQRAFVLILFALLTSNGSLLFAVQKRSSPIKVGWEIAVENRNQSAQLNRFFGILAHYPSQGVSAAGASAFAYKGITIDLLGLNNTAMAHADQIKDQNAPKNHASFNKEVFFSQKPDLFWVSGAFVKNGYCDSLVISNYFSIIYKNIQQDPRFKNQYSNCTIIRKNDQLALAIFASRQFLQTLDTTYFKVVRHD